MGRSMVPGSRASRALAALAGSPGGLLTPDIARILGEYPWGLTEIAAELRKQEARGNVTADRSGHGVTVLWKLTEQGAASEVIALDIAVRLLEEALHLRMNGERAPGGNETWQDWDRKAEAFLRARLDRLHPARPR